MPNAKSAKFLNKLFGNWNLEFGDCLEIRLIRNLSFFIEKVLSAIPKEREEEPY